MTFPLRISSNTSGTCIFPLPWMSEVFDLFKLWQQCGVSKTCKESKNTNRAWLMSQPQHHSLFNIIINLFSAEIHTCQPLMRHSMTANYLICRERLGPTVRHYIRWRLCESLQVLFVFKYLKTSAFVHPNPNKRDSVISRLSALISGTSCFKSQATEGVPITFNKNTRIRWLIAQ